MRSYLALAIIAIVTGGCQARATDSRHEDAIYNAVQKIMCSASEKDRKMAVFALADEVQAYQPQGEDDSAGGSIQVAIEGYEDEGCPKASAPSMVSPVR
jgi:hypothetical protein